jgi:Tol biopolymer transport system component
MSAVAALALLLVGLTGFMLMTPAPGPLRAEPMKFEIVVPEGVSLFTGSAAGMPEIAISPDGGTVGFVGRAQGKPQQLWLRSLAELEFRALEGTEGATVPIWSPDSASLAFTAGAQIRVVTLETRAVRVLAALPADLIGNPLGGSWGTVGVILLGSRAGAGDRGLIRIDVSTGRVSRQTSCTGECARHALPAFLPDGRRFVYSAEPQGILLGSLDAPDSRQVLPDFGQAVPVGDRLFAFLSSGPTLLSYPFDMTNAQITGEPVAATDRVAYIAQNRRAAFSVADNGTLLTAPSPATSQTQLTWIARDGTRGPTITQPGFTATVRVSPDGKRAVFGQRDGQGSQQLWVVDERGSITKITFDGLNADGAWSPNGREIAHSSLRLTGKEIYIGSSFGLSQQERKVPIDGNDLSLDDWSNDGRFLLYHIQSRRELWAKPIDGDGKPILIVNPPSGNVDQASFSNDGRWIVYDSEETGRSEISVTPFPQLNERWLVSKDGGVQPTWRADGREIYFLARDGAMMAADVRSTASGLEFGAPHELFKTGLTPLFGTEQYDVSPDGRFLIMLPRDSGAARPSDRLVVWTNWRPPSTPTPR